MSKEIILRWVRVFLKKYFGVGYVLEALQINSKKIFWGVTLVFLPMVARIVQRSIDSVCTSHER